MSMASRDVCWGKRMGRKGHQVQVQSTLNGRWGLDLGGSATGLAQDSQEEGLQVSADRPTGGRGWPWLGRATCSTGPGAPPFSCEICLPLALVTLPCPVPIFLPLCPSRTSCSCSLSTEYICQRQEDAIDGKETASCCLVFLYPASSKRLRGVRLQSPPGCALQMPNSGFPFPPPTLGEAGWGSECFLETRLRICVEWLFPGVHGTHAYPLSCVDTMGNLT